MNKRKRSQIRKILKPERRRRGIRIRSAHRSLDAFAKLISREKLHPWQKKLLRLMEDFKGVTFPIQSGYRSKPFPVFRPANQHGKTQIRTTHEVIYDEVVRVPPDFDFGKIEKHIAALQAETERAFLIAGMDIPKRLGGVTAAEAMANLKEAFDKLPKIKY